MSAHLRSTALIGMAITCMSAVVPKEAQAQGYQIDCAILLCLSGGWPASVPCAAARAEFIRRITPWPVEPPLQIWRCPMSASYSDDGEGMTLDRFWDVLLDDEAIPLQSIPMTDLEAISPEPAVVRITGGTAAPLPDGFALQLAQSADIDISDPAFDFVRSIRVYDVDWYEYDHENWEGDHTCRRPRQRVRLGTYGVQGDFAWRSAPVTTATSETWMGFTTRRHESCSHAGRFRGVAVEWNDYEGNHGYEVVTY